MNTPIDVTLGLSILAAVVGFIAGAAFATWCYRRRKPKWPRFDHDMQGLIPLSGASERFFRHDLSDTRRIG